MEFVTGEGSSLLCQAPNSNVGGVAAEPITEIDRYFNKAGLQICLSTKDGTL
jgi:hypothetical protein